jgi:hypothetical protein
MLQIALVADEHDDNVGVCVVAKLLEPSLDVGVRWLLGDVVHQEGSDGASVVTEEVGRKEGWARGAVEGQEGI